MDVMSAQTPDFFRLILALLLVLGMMGGLSFALRKLGLAQSIKIQSGGKPRLSITESLPLDARRRVVLIRRDNVEHLVILNANGETLLESGIVTQPVDSSTIHKDGT